MSERLQIRDMTSAHPGRFPELFRVLVSCESSRGGQEFREREKSLVEFEREYHGVEVGYVRRAINRTVNAAFVNAESKALLDYGCGGAWWKEDYWPMFRRVVAVDVNEENLEDISRNYNGGNVELAYTSNGLIECDERFDYVLSSSVVGYIHPLQADAHLRSCFDLLAPGGTLVLSRVRAYNLGHWLRGVRLETISGFSFTYPYRKRELMATLSNVGFRNVQYQEHGVWFPFGDKLNQQLFRWCPCLMRIWAPRVCPFLRFQHMVTATK